MRGESYDKGTREKEERSERGERKDLRKKEIEKKRDWWNKKLIFMFNLMLQ